jgi:hypothetical protein
VAFVGDHNHVLDETQINGPGQASIISFQVLCGSSDAESSPAKIWECFSLADEIGSGKGDKSCATMLGKGG